MRRCFAVCRCRLYWVAKQLAFQHSPIWCNFGAMLLGCKQPNLRRLIFHKKPPHPVKDEAVRVTCGDVLPPFAGVGYVGLPNSWHSNVHRFGGHRNVPTLPGWQLRLRLAKKAACYPCCSPSEGNGNKKPPHPVRDEAVRITCGDVLPFAGVGYVGLPDSRHSNVYRFGGHRNVPTLPGCDSQFFRPRNPRRRGE